MPLWWFYTTYRSVKYLVITRLIIRFKLKWGHIRKSLDLSDFFIAHSTAFAAIQRVRNILTKIVRSCRIRLHLVLMQSEPPGYLITCLSVLILYYIWKLYLEVLSSNPSQQYIQITFELF